MNKSILAVTLAAVLGLTLSSAPALAKDKIKNITCDQYLVMDSDTQKNVAYWLDGVETATSDIKVGALEIEVGYTELGDPVAALVTACEGDREASLWDKIKAKFHKKES